MVFNVSLVLPQDNINYPIDGVETIALAGKRYLIISVENVGFKHVSEIIFPDTGIFAQTVNIDGRVFTLDLTLSVVMPYFEFVPVLLEDRCTFEMDYYFCSSFFSGGTTDTSLLDSLNGNFGSYPDGAQVVVQGLTTRTYTVQSSSLGWDSPSTGSLIITYRLKDADDNFLEAPHVLLTLKA